MITNTSRYKDSAYHYYRCKREAHYGPDACPQRSIRIERVEPLVRDFVVGVLSDPDTIRRGLDALARRDAEETRKDPKLTVATLTEKLAENARLRRAYQDQQAAGLMTLEELAARLEELEANRNALEAELASLEHSRQKAEELERDRNAALVSLSATIPEALENLTGEEINTVYRKLRLRLMPREGGYDATGILCSLEPTSADRRDPRAPSGKALSPKLQRSRQTGRARI